MNLRIVLDGTSEGINQFFNLVKVLHGHSFGNKLHLLILAVDNGSG